MKRGIPNILMRSDNRSKLIDPQLLPSVRVATEQYNAHGGTISEPCSFGSDPLEHSDTKKSIRYETFCSRYSFKSLFCDVSNDCGSSFKEALCYFIDVTYRLAHTTWTVAVHMLESYPLLYLVCTTVSNFFKKNFFCWQKKKVLDTWQENCEVSLQSGPPAKELSTISPVVQSVQWLAGKL